MDKDLIDAALNYHRFPTAGKISVTPTKSLSNQRDLSLAYSPGVAAACTAIAENEALAYEYTSKGNLVAVISNGTAVLGLGNIGPLAGKPVMEGKGCLFKKFANIDVFDIELDEKDPDKLVEIVAALEPTLGGVNLEDIKAPECFYIEKKLRERMKIPVFHDDQHGTAIISSAGLLNGLKIVDKRIEEIKLVCSGAGAAAIACLDLMVKLGVRRENVYVCDSRGVIWEGRDAQMETNKKRYAQKTEARTLADVIEGADVFLGVSAAKALTPDMLKKMADKPLIFALANPEPEILPELAKATRPDCVIATGRSDYPNQINNVLCFPFIFRGALDVGATTINDEMKLACVKAIAALAQAEQSDLVALAYEGEQLKFGPNYFIPTPFDPRLIVTLAPAVAKAAMESGVATRPIADLDAYARSLSNFVYQTGIVMGPIFNIARQIKPELKRVVFAEGEDLRVLHASRELLEENIARPILIGRPEIIENQIQQQGLNLVIGKDIQVLDPENNQDYQKFCQEYFQLMSYKGVTPTIAKTRLRTNNTIIACMLLRNHVADAMICGTMESYDYHLGHIKDIIGLAPNAKLLAAVSLLQLPKKLIAITDTHVNEEPCAQDLMEIAHMAAQELSRMGIDPKLALLSHSSFGSCHRQPAAKMREAVKLIKQAYPNLNVDGEMHADAALSENIRHKINPNNELTGDANVLVMPNIDAANISCNLLRVAGDGLLIGPLLLGSAQPAHIVTHSTTVRRLVNVTALAVVDAQELRKTTK